MSWTRKAISAPVYDNWWQTGRVILDLLTDSIIKVYLPPHQIKRYFFLIKFHFVVSLCHYHLFQVYDIKNSGYIICNEIARWPVKFKTSGRLVCKETVVLNCFLFRGPLSPYHTPNKSRIYSQLEMKRVSDHKYLQLRLCFVAIETGWAITAHAVGLGRPMDEHLQTTGKAVPGYDGKKMTIVTCEAANWVWYGTWLVIEPKSFIKQASLDLVWSRVHYPGVFLLIYMLKKEEDYI